MKTGQGLKEYAIAQLGKPYWWGTFGQRADGALHAQKKKQYPAYYTAADFHNQYGQKVHDCCGLIKGYLWCDTPDGSPKYNAAQDVAVEGLYRKCNRKGGITTMPEIPGVCVFMANMGHVGVYIGNGEVVEAMGQAYGVVKTKVAGRGWAYWGMPEWISYDDAAEDGPSGKPAHTTGTDFSLNFRILREGSVGEDVKALQLLLKARGYQCGSYGVNKDGADGEFGSGTASKLKAYQSANSLEADGEAGPLTMKKLLGLS